MLALEAFFMDPETAKEYEATLHSIHVEYPTWLLLTTPGVSLEIDVPETPERLREFRELVTGAVADTQMLWSFEYLAAGRDKPTALDALTFKTRLHNLLVRQPAYPNHQREQLAALYKPVDELLGRVVSVR